MYTELYAKECYDYIVSLATKLDCVNLAHKIYNDYRFMKCTGSSRPELHHYGNHGLIVHTFEVIRNALEFNKIYNSNIDEKLLFLSALYHDSGKMDDYISLDGTNWSNTVHKYQIYHISESNVKWNIFSREYNYDWLNKNFIDSVSHAILAHHALPEWRSPVKPQTKLAWIIHLADNLSARMCDCQNLT
jgi:23S rRNA maturation-related 3'-5' exoribonuclease YhaM